MYLHFCMNKFVGASLLQNLNTECGKCGMKEDAKKKGCCKDEEQKIKLTDEHQKSITNFSSLQPFEVIIKQIYPTEEVINKFTTTLVNVILHPPPKINKQNFEILYCSFLI